MNIHVNGREISWLDDSENIAYVERTSKTRFIHRFSLNIYNAIDDTNMKIFETDEILRNLRVTQKGHIWINELDGTNEYLFNRKGKRLREYYNEKVLVFDHDLNLVRMNIDGSNREMIQSRGWRGELSGDERYIIYNFNGYLHKYTISTNGKNRLVWGNNGIWSPDDNYIIYEVTNEDGHSIHGSDLYIINSDGFNVKQLTFTAEIQEGNPSISPDGKKIAFTCYKTNAVYIADIEF